MQIFPILFAALLFVIRLSAITAFEDELDREKGHISAMWSEVVRQTIVTPTSTWCIADSTVDDSTLQAALDYACGQTTADCSGIKLGAPCFFPNTIVHHASYVFNSYYQMNAKGANTCSFGGAAKVTTTNPSNGTCDFSSSGSLSESTRVIDNDGTKLVPHGVLILVTMCLLLMQAARGTSLGW